METDRGVIAVVDIGKTNAKLTLTDAADGSVLWTAERPNAPVARGPVRDLGAEATWTWLRDSFDRAPGKRRIRAIVPVAHGAAIALLDRQGRLICAPDYEDPVFDEVASSYAALRDPFALTLSPAAARGLNLGRQLHFLQTHTPDLYAATGCILTYAQYWAFLLCGARASEATSLGAHTDLWLPTQGRFSPLTERQGWADLIAPPRPAGDALGTLRPGLARELGMDPGCAVLCGLHDSNASYLCHRASRGDSPFAMISSGTWTIVMATRADPARLVEARDMLANVDAFGAAVGTARFMGGREYAAIAGLAAPAPERVAGVLADGAMALPTFALGGPFAGRPGGILDAARQDATGLATLASLYVALVVDVMLDLLGVRGDLIVDGPLAQNAVFAAALAGLRPDPVRVSLARAGTLAGARRLVRGNAEPPPSLRAIAAAPHDLSGYRARWRGRVGL